MKRTIFAVFFVSGWLGAQPPTPDALINAIVHGNQDNQQTAAQTELLRQQAAAIAAQTKLVQQQTAALKQQNQAQQAQKNQPPASLAGVDQMSTTVNNMRMINGRSWNFSGMSLLAKTAYLLGISEEIKIKSLDALIASGQPRPSDWDTFYGPDWTDANLNDYIAILDALYQQPENLKIPVAYAVRYYCVPKMRGLFTADQMDARLVTLRAVISAMENQNTK